MVFALIVFACQESHTSDTMQPATPTIMMEFTNENLVVGIDGDEVNYLFGITMSHADKDAVSWTGEDCYLGWHNDYTGGTILHCHPLTRGINSFRAGANAEGLDPNTETWFGIGQLYDPNIVLSYSVWLSDQTDCWTLGGDYYLNVCSKLSSRGEVVK